MTKLDGKTPDLAAENIEQLRQIFPDVFEEGKIDFDKLKQVLGEYVDDEKERYNFTWNGKGKALRLAQTPTTGTLRPCKEESKNWDDTQNLYIEGDNLEVLKLLQKSYHGKIKMIYIDPPYNTGGDFVYPDDFSDSIENYKRITGQVDEDGKRLSTNTEASGRYHTDWLNMMYPRLRLARNLLANDGVIFVSIDNNEYANAQKICDEVFGNDNCIGVISAVVHMDEKTPHMHLSFVPLTADGRLSAKEIVGNKKKLTQWQDNFWSHMVRAYPELERGESASQTGRDHIPPRVFKEMTRLTKQKAKLEELLAGIGAFNAKSRAAEIAALLDKYIPAVEQMHTTMKKYQVVFTATTAENKKLKQENAQLEQSLDKATKESTLKQLADAKLRRDYADAVAVLDRIPKEVLDVYARGDHRREERPIEER